MGDAGQPRLPWRGVADQQLGRTRDRERAGSTGRAGRSQAADRLAGIFFIGKYLNSIHHSTCAAKMMTRCEYIRDEGRITTNE